jgi:hypothetical protein
MSPPTVRRPLVALLAAALCLAAGPSALQGKTLTVTKKETRLRKDKRMFAPAVAVLREGDRLTETRQEGPWRLANWKNAQGWIHESDVSSNPAVRLSGQGVRETYSPSEAAAARKGFNPEVERQYKQDHPALQAAFDKVDEIQKRTLSEDQVLQFRRAGRLEEASR